MASPHPRRQRRGHSMPSTRIGMTRTFSIASYPVVFTPNRVHDDLERRGEKQKERQRNSQTSKESR
jgi:hypothetical protein